MTIKISYRGAPIEEIVKKNACIIGFSLSNSFSQLNLDSLQINNGYIRLNRNLPNGMSVEFFIYEMSESMYKKYADLNNLSVSMENISIEARL